MTYRHTESYQAGKEAVEDRSNVSVDDLWDAIRQYPQLANEIVVSALYDVVDMAKMSVEMRQTMDRLFMMFDETSRHAGSTENISDVLGVGVAHVHYQARLTA